MKEQLAATVEKSKNYTLQVANAMPADGYDFKPAGAGWNFGELLHHIAYGIQWWQDNYITGKNSQWEPPATVIRKEAVITYLTKSFEMLQATLHQQPLNDQSVYGVHATLDHITHHRGQAVLYLRTNGVEPPEYGY